MLRKIIDSIKVVFWSIVYTIKIIRYYKQTTKKRPTHIDMTGNLH